MARTQAITISVKIPINWESMTKRAKRRLKQIASRDSRVIQAYLGIIEQQEAVLLRGKKRKRIDQTKLDALTVPTSWGKKGNLPRTNVPHDMKTRFPRISANEISDCRRTAVALYESYLALRSKKGMRASRPRAINSSRRVPRWTFPQCFKLVWRTTKAARLWLDLRDSLDSNLLGLKVHQRLRIPLKISPFHTKQLRRGEPRALQIYTDGNRKWWATLSVKVEVVFGSTPPKPKAVLGIDLGVKKAACTTLLTESKVSETRYFVQKEKVAVISKYDSRVAELQRVQAIRTKKGLKSSSVTKRLKAMGSKRENAAKEYDRVLVRDILDYIEELSSRFDLYIALGRVKGIRSSARRGNTRGSKFRALVHSWSFGRISQSLKHALAQSGWKVEGSEARFRAIPEQWTSIMCWKCGRKGNRPKQNLFTCSCGFKTNADRNGSLNIARRLIKLIPSLKNETHGLGRWSTPARPPAPNARRKANPSKKKSLLPSKDEVSHPGESAAVHTTQTSLLSFGDKPGMSDNDPAVENSMETFSVPRTDASGYEQETEAKSEGGIPSQ